MSLTAAQKHLLQTALKQRSRRELKALFATVRSHDDRTLFAALAPGKKKAKRAGDPLVRDLELTLKPLLGPASEKAELLVEHLAKKHRRKFSFEPTGVAAAVRHLRAADLSDTQISAGAKSLMAHLARLHGCETVV